MLHIWATIPKYRENRYCHLTMDERGLLKNPFQYVSNPIKSHDSPPDLANLEMDVPYPFVDIQGERRVWMERRRFKVISSSQPKGMRVL